jgi:UMF1 family MFS transporter
MTDASIETRKAANAEREARRVGGVMAPAGFSWALFEFARNPYYMMIVVYVFPTYFSQVVVGDPVLGQALIFQATKWAGIICALTAPFLGAMMDRGGRRKPWMAVFLGSLCISGAALFWSLPGGAGLGIVLTMVFLVFGFVGYTYSEMMHNAMLRSSGRADALSQISGTGLALGQLSSALCLAALVVVAAVAPALGGQDGDFLLQRGVGPFVALWLVVFVVPFFIYMPDGGPLGGTWIKAAVEIGRAIKPKQPRPAWRWYLPCFIVLSLLILILFYDVLGSQNWPIALGLAVILGAAASLPVAPRIAAYLGRYLRESPDAMKYLAARLIYADGLTALLAGGGVYTAGMLGWDTSEQALYGIYGSIFGFVGGLFIAGPLDRALGPRRAIILNLGVLCLAVMIALSVTQQSILFGLIPSAQVLHGGPYFNTFSDVFYLAMVAVIAMSSTALISSSRFFLITLAPKERISEFFGLFALSGTITVWIGPMLIEFATRQSGDQRIGFSPVLLLFAVGLALMLTLKPGAAESARGQASPRAGH